MLLNGIEVSFVFGWFRLKSRKFEKPRRDGADALVLGSQGAGYRVTISRLSINQVVPSLAAPRTTNESPTLGTCRLARERTVM